MISRLRMLRSSSSSCVGRRLNRLKMCVKKGVNANSTLRTTLEGIHLVRRAPTASRCICLSRSVWAWRIPRSISSCLSGLMANFKAKLSFRAIRDASRAAINQTRERHTSSSHPSDFFFVSRKNESLATFFGHVFVFVVTVKNWAVWFIWVVVDLYVDGDCDRYWQVVWTMSLGWRRRRYMVLVLIIVVRLVLHIMIVIVGRSRSVVWAAVATQADAKP